MNFFRELSRVLILVRRHCACAHGFLHLFDTAVKAAHADGQSILSIITAQ